MRNIPNSILALAIVLLAAPAYAEKSDIRLLTLHFTNTTRPYADRYETAIVKAEDVKRFVYQKVSETRSATDTLQTIFSEVAVIDTDGEWQADTDQPILVEWSVVFRATGTVATAR